MLEDKLTFEAIMRSPEAQDIMKDVIVKTWKRNVWKNLRGEDLDLNDARLNRVVLEMKGGFHYIRDEFDYIPLEDAVAYMKEWYRNAEAARGIDHVRWDVEDAANLKAILDTYP